jgi:hypothetical protein
MKTEEFPELNLEIDPIQGRSTAIYSIIENISDESISSMDDENPWRECNSSPPMSQACLVYDLVVA